MTSPAMQLEVEARLDAIGGQAAKLLGLIEAFSRGSRGDCRAKARTLGRKMARSDRSIRRYLAELSANGLIRKVQRRCRFSIRTTTDIGSLVLARLNAPNRTSYLARQAGTPPTTAASAYRPPSGRWKRRDSIDLDAWEKIATWMEVSGDATSLARAKMAHRRFSAIAAGLERTWEWQSFASAHPGFTGSDLVREAVESAMDASARFGTVESAVAYIAAILTDCVRLRRLPSRAPP